MSTEQLAAPPKNDLRTFIAGDQFKKQVALALPRHMTPDRFARVALTAITRTPKLLDCTRESLLKCLMDCSQFGLEPDGRHAHLIPYGKDCTLIIDYKGLIALARRSGQVAVFRGELVKENDDFSWRNGVVAHDINWRADRGKTECVYSYVKFNDGSEDWEVMTLAEVNAIRERSRAKNAGPWVTDFDEMAKKTVIRRHSKRLTLSPEFADAIDRDDDRPERTVRDVSPARVPALLPEKAPRTGEREPDPVDDSVPTSARAAVERKAKEAGVGIGDVFTAMRALGITTAPHSDDVEPHQWATAEAGFAEIVNEIHAR